VQLQQRGEQDFRYWTPRRNETHLVFKSEQLLDFLLAVGCCLWSLSWALVALGVASSQCPRPSLTERTTFQRNRILQRPRKCLLILLLRRVSFARSVFARRRCGEVRLRCGWGFGLGLLLPSASQVGGIQDQAYHSTQGKILNCSFSGSCSSPSSSLLPRPRVRSRPDHPCLNRQPPVLLHCYPCSPCSPPLPSSPLSVLFFSFSFSSSLASSSSFFFCRTRHISP
jgi:hypothetical protein